MAPGAKFIWTPFHEIQLFDCFDGLIIKRLNKHFVSAIVLERFYSRVNKSVPLEITKERMEVYFSSLPDWKEHFSEPDTYEEEEFSLPIDDFPDIYPCPDLKNFRVGELTFDEIEFSLPADEYPQVVQLTTPPVKKRGRPKIITSAETREL